MPVQFAELRGSAPPSGRLSMSSVVATSLALAAGLAVVLSLSPALFRDSPSQIGIVWRVGQLLLVVALLVSGGGVRLYKADWRLISPWLFSLAVLSLFHFDTLEYWWILLRQLSLVSVFLLCLTAGETVLGWKVVRLFVQVVFAGVLLLTSLAVLPGLGSGWDWEQGRELKTAAFQDGVVQFNATLFVIALGVAALQWSRIQLVSLVTWFVILSLASATRTPLVGFAFACSVCAFLGVAGRLGRKRILKLAAVFVLITMPLALLWHMTQHPDPEVARTLAGRLHLWQAGIQQWLNSPIAGDLTTGFHDALDNSYSRFVFLFKWESDALYELESGGFHSIWIQALANLGLIGFFGVAVSYFRLLDSSVMNRNSTPLTFVVLLCLARSFTEYSGLFSAGRASLDLVCFVALAFVILRSRHRL